MAEGVFRRLVEQAGLGDRFIVESVATGGWNVGKRPHPGTLRELQRHGINLGDKRARQLSRRDLETADYVIAMDRSNLRALQRYARDGILDHKLYLLLDFAADVNVREVPDPYYEGRFDQVYELIEAGCHGLLEHIRSEHNL
jgi:protein-tyrosine phosphatase